MRNSTLILFGLLLVLLAVSSADGASTQRGHRSPKKEKAHPETGKRKHAEKDANRKSEGKKKPQERELLERTSTNNKYSHYYDAPQHHEIKNSKGFDETKARIAADAELSKKPNTYLESIGGGQGGSKEVQQKLAKQRVQKGLRYH